MRARAGRLLRRWADRIDPANTPRKSGYSYTVELGSRTKYPNGIAVHVDGTGCPFYVMPVDGDRRFTEAATDWRIGSTKTAAMFAEHGEPARAYGGPVLPPQPMPYDPATDGPIRRLEDR